MSDKVYKGKTLSFYELLKEHKIEIPIIQRDYAQGRVDKKEIRLNFLNALYESITSDKPIQLDFVYGSNVNNAFLPLDGQQRLTTLFLLHWYASVLDSVLPSESRYMLSKFSYETRITSRDFCYALINNSFQIHNESQILSSTIIDSNWFFLSWKNDPTIDSMLRTIDDIHMIFFHTENLWSKLTKNGLISFYYVELENIGLTDDLYIKMNARGKLLTSFENFKAGLQKHVNDNSWEEGNKVFTDCFAFKIDTAWTDYFWNNFRKNNSIDDALMRFISTIAMIRQAIERTTQKAEERFQIITSLQEQPNSVRPDYFSQTAFSYLIECFEIYEGVTGQKVSLQLTFPLWRHKPKRTILSEVVYEDNVYSTVQINSANYTQKVLFFAQTEYLRRVDCFELSSFQDWMRVIRNIISRGDIDKDGNRPDIIRSPQSFDGVINLIHELSEGCEDIYQHLSTLGLIKSLFAKDQVEEEKNKAKLIVLNPELKKLIFAAEDNELLRGRIDFILFCIDYDNCPEHFNVELFAKIQEVFSIYFNKEADVSNDLRRAFLTIEVAGKYEFYNYWWSFWHVISATKRRLFDKFRELEYYMYGDFKTYFKKLILKLLDKDVHTIVSDFAPPIDMPNWKKRLIKEPDLLNMHGKSNYIAIPDDNSCCYLLRSKRPRDFDGCIKIE